MLLTGWAAPETADTAEHTQAGALITYLEQSGQWKGQWTDYYFWVDWACIDQDDAQLKARQIQALPIYMRCCNYFVGLAWGSYLERAWCRLEAKGFRSDISRKLIKPDGEYLNVGFDEVDALMGGAPEEGQCQAADRPVIQQVMKALAQVDKAFGDTQLPDVVAKVESWAELIPLAQLVTAAKGGDIPALRAALENMPAEASVSLDSCPAGEVDGHAACDVYNWPENESNNALHWAAQYGHPEAVKLLLEHGATPTVRNRSQRTAWQLATHTYHSPAFPKSMRDPDEEAMAARVLQCVEAFEERARAGDEGLQAEARARDEKQRRLDGVLTHEWRAWLW